LGHCGGCHTPKDILFGDITSKAFTGGVVDHWYAADLTGNPHIGLGRWSHEDVVRFLTTGRNTYATAAGNMQEKVTLSTSHMTHEDRAAIAAYLKSLPASGPQAPAEPNPAQTAEGQAIFVARCQGCHQRPGQPGPLPDYPQLAGDTLILARDPTTVARIILQGAESPVTPSEKTTYSMPAFTVLSDEQIAAVATYIRNSWGNRAEPVTSHAVKVLRAAIQ
jgi:mono/diheme cytochrome c family protein